MSKEDLETQELEDRAFTLFENGRYSEAESLFLMCAERGWAWCWSFVVSCRGLLNDSAGVQLALMKLREAADAGDPDCALSFYELTEIGLLELDRHVAQDLGHHYLRKAASLGHPFASAKLAERFLDGRENGSEDVEQYLYWMQSSLIQLQSPELISETIQKLQSRSVPLPEWLHRLSNESPRRPR
jgi:TPR repeat protein